MSKSAARKKKRTARGKPRKSASRRDLPNQGRRAEPGTAGVAVAEAAQPARAASPSGKEHAESKEREEDVEQPLILRAQAKLFWVLAGIVIDVALGWLWSRSVAHAHGVAGVGKIAAVTILPLIAVMYAIGMAQRGFWGAGALSKTARTKVISLCLAVLIIMPELWAKVGSGQICQHTFIGGLAGFAAAFLAWAYLAVRRNPWLVRQQPRQWEWVYRLSVTGMIIIGGWIGVIVS